MSLPVALALWGLVYLVVMHHGRLEACGTHEEVFAVSRTYQEYLQSAEAS